jgi:hypothetical protein
VSTGGLGSATMPAPTPPTSRSCPVTWLRCSATTAHGPVLCKTCIELLSRTGHWPSSPATRPHARGNDGRGRQRYARWTPPEGQFRWAGGRRHLSFASPPSRRKSVAIRRSAGSLAEPPRSLAQRIRRNHRITPPSFLYPRRRQNPPHRHFWNDRKDAIPAGTRDNNRMRQLQFFTTAELAGMRDRTASRNHSPGRDKFRREHERHRAWGLTRRHAERLRHARNNPRHPPATHTTAPPRTPAQPQQTHHHLLDTRQPEPADTNQPQPATDTAPSADNEQRRPRGTSSNEETTDTTPCRPDPPGIPHRNHPEGNIAPYSQSQENEPTPSSAPTTQTSRPRAPLVKQRLITSLESEQFLFPVIVSKGFEKSVPGASRNTSRRQETAPVPRHPAVGDDRQPSWAGARAGHVDGTKAGNPEPSASRSVAPESPTAPRPIEVPLSRTGPRWAAIKQIAADVRPDPTETRPPRVPAHTRRPLPVKGTARTG